MHLSEYTETVDVFVDDEYIESMSSIGGFRESYIGEYSLGSLQSLKIVSQGDESCVWEQEFGISDCSETIACPDCMVEIIDIECNDNGSYNLLVDHNFFENGFECINLSIQGFSNSYSNYSNHFSGP